MRLVFDGYYGKENRAWLYCKNMPDCSSSCLLDLKSCLYKKKGALIDTRFCRLMHAFMARHNNTVTKLCFVSSQCALSEQLLYISNVIILSRRNRQTLGGMNLVEYTLTEYNDVFIFFVCFKRKHYTYKELI